MEHMPLLTVILGPSSSGPLSARLQLYCAGLDGRIWTNAARKLLVEYAEYLWRRKLCFFLGLPVTGVRGRLLLLLLLLLLLVSLLLDGS